MVTVKGTTSLIPQQFNNFLTRRSLRQSPGACFPRTSRVPSKFWNDNLPILTHWAAHPFDCSSNSEATNLTVGESALDEKSSFKLLGLLFSSKRDCSSYIARTAKTAPKKLEPWFVRSLFLLQPRMKNYYACAGVLICYLIVG